MVSLAKLLASIESPEVPENDAKNVNTKVGESNRFNTQKIFNQFINCCDHKTKEDNYAPSRTMKHETNDHSTNLTPMSRSPWNWQFHNFNHNQPSI